MNHVDDSVWDWFLGALDAGDEEAFVAHVDACPRCRRLVDEQVAEAAAITAAAEESASVSARERLLARATTLARFDRFADDVAELADVELEVARGWLGRLDDHDVWQPTALGDLTIYHIDGGPAVADAIVGFVRLAGGTDFPTHTHVGSEHLLILQGGMRDENGLVHGPGSRVDRAAGTEHTVGAAPGHDLVYLSVVHEGLEIFGMRFGPDSAEL